MQRNFKKYLLFGILYVGIQEFWVSVIWRQDIVSFILAVVITETLFLSFTFYAGKTLERFVSPRFVDFFTYLVSGIVGLATIEWYFAGNAPGQTEANQFVMFTTWGGAALFARIQTDNLVDSKMKKIILRLFLVFSVPATVLGLLLLFVNPPLSFAVTYVAAVLGYPLMNILFVWFFIKKARGLPVTSNGTA